MKFFLRIRSLALTSAVVAISASFAGRLAWAETIYTSTNLDIVASAPVDVGTTPLKAITLTAVGKNGCIPTGFDSTKSDFDGLGTGITTSGNFLHQVGIKAGEYPFPLNNDLYTPTNNPQITPVLDTHFLIDPNTYLSFYGPSETMNVINTADDIYGHYGDSLVGTFSLNGLPINSLWNFAYIVVPNNTVVRLNFEITAIFNEIQFAAGVDYFLPVPEPNGLILLSTFGIGLLIHARRRRKA